MQNAWLDVTEQKRKKYEHSSALIKLRRPASRRAFQMQNINPRHPRLLRSQDKSVEARTVMRSRKQLREKDSRQ